MSTAGFSYGGLRETLGKAGINDGGNALFAAFKIDTRRRKIRDLLSTGAKRSVLVLIDSELPKKRIPFGFRL